MTQDISNDYYRCEAVLIREWNVSICLYAVQICVHWQEIKENTGTKRDVMNAMNNQFKESIDWM